MNLIITELSKYVYNYLKYNILTLYYINNEKFLFAKKFSILIITYLKTYTVKLILFKLH